jgi:IS30 family transposase
MDKKYQHLSRYERYYISKTIANTSVAEIAKTVGYHRSTIYRELKRNSDEYGTYTVSGAMQKVNTRTRDKYDRFAQITNRIKTKIVKGLTDKSSLEQIAGRINLRNKNKVSVRTLYNYIATDKEFGGNLYKLLPRKGKRYKYRGIQKTVIKNRVDISLRPKVVELKSRIGDLEADTIVGKQNGSKECLGTFVDRKAKYTIILKLKDKSAKTMQLALEEYFMKSVIPIHTVTSDNGTEFAYHQEIADNINCKWYFARPYKSCDRGLNEHTNELIRRFFPKGTDFSSVSTDEVQRVQDLLNNRPRKSLGFLTPNEIINRHLRYLNYRCRT